MMYCKSTSSQINGEVDSAVSDIINCIDYVIDNNASIVNCSFDFNRGILEKDKVDLLGAFKRAKALMPEQEVCVEANPWQ